MKMTLSLYDFRTEWARSSRKDSFSYNGLELLYDHLEETDPDYDLDIVELDSSWTEAGIDQILNDYDLDLNPKIENALERALEALNDKTIALGITSEDTIVFLEF